MAVVGVLGDIHGNHEALEAALKALDALGVARIACVGDIIGYNADPDACVATLRERGVVSVAGNHDLIGTHRLGFEQCSNKAMHALKRTRRMLRHDAALYLASLPAHWLLDDRTLLIHGGVRDVRQYMTQLAHFAENAEYVRADFPRVKLCFFGHTHEQRILECDGPTVTEHSVAGEEPVALSGRGLYFVNPGSVDASRKREAKLAEFAVFDTDVPSVAFYRVAYEDARAEAKAVAAGLRIGRWLDRLYDYRRRLIA